MEINCSLLSHCQFVALCLQWILGTSSQALTTGHGMCFHAWNSEVPLSMSWSSGPRAREMQEFCLPCLTPTVPILVYCLKTLLLSRLLFWGEEQMHRKHLQAWSQSTNWRLTQHIFIFIIYRAS